MEKELKLKSKENKIKEAREKSGEHEDKPFLIGDIIQGMRKGGEFQEILEKHGINDKDVINAIIDDDCNLLERAVVDRLGKDTDDLYEFKKYQLKGIIKEEFQNILLTKLEELE